MWYRYTYPWSINTPFSKLELSLCRQSSASCLAQTCNWTFHSSYMNKIVDCTRTTNREKQLCSYCTDYMLRYSKRWSLATFMYELLRLWGVYSLIEAINWFNNHHYCRQSSVHKHANGNSAVFHSSYMNPYQDQQGQLETCKVTHDTTHSQHSSTMHRLEFITLWIL